MSPGYIYYMERLAHINFRSATEHKTIDLIENESICIQVENKSSDKSSVAYVSVLAVDAAGTTTLVSRAWERGIRLSYELPRRLLASDTMPLKGIPISWPKSVPRQGRVEETLVFVITSEEIDLRFLETSSAEDGRVARELLTARSRLVTPYDVTRIGYFLQPLNP